MCIIVQSMKCILVMGSYFFKAGCMRGGAGARINLIMRGIERNGELAKHRAAAHKLVKGAANQGRTEGLKARNHQQEADLPPQATRNLKGEDRIIH